MCIERAALINPRVEKSRLVSSLISGAHFTCFTGTTAQSTASSARGISLISEAVDMRACRMLKKHGVVWGSRSWGGDVYMGGDTEMRDAKGATEGEDAEGEADVPCGSSMLEVAKVVCRLVSSVQVAGTQFTCFTGTKVQMLTLRTCGRWRQCILCGAVER